MNKIFASKMISFHILKINIFLFFCRKLNVRGKNLANYSVFEKTTTGLQLTRSIPVHYVNVLTRKNVQNTTWMWALFLEKSIVMIVYALIVPTVCEASGDLVLLRKLHTSEILSDQNKQVKDSSAPSLRTFKYNNQESKQKQTYDYTRE